MLNLSHWNISQSFSLMKIDVIWSLNNVKWTSTKKLLYMKHLPSRVQVTIAVVARSPEIFNRGSSPVFSRNLELVEVLSQPPDEVRRMDQLLYVAFIILHIQELVRWFNSCEGPRKNSTRVKFAIYCATYSRSKRVLNPMCISKLRRTFFQTTITLDLST